LVCLSLGGESDVFVMYLNMLLAISGVISSKGSVLNRVTSLFRAMKCSL
jgi:hypothetical protein